MTADQLIKSLRLAPHPEGGFFRETYRAAGTIAGNALPNGFAGDRVFSTSIYYLLQGSQVSALHRIRSDELWHFHMGDALEVILHRFARSTQGWFNYFRHCHWNIFKA